MLEKRINEIEAKASAMAAGEAKDDLMELIAEVRKLRRAICQNGSYRSITYPNTGKVVLFDWAKAVLNETS